MILPSRQKPSTLWPIFSKDEEKAFSGSRLVNACPASLATRFCYRFCEMPRRLLALALLFAFCCPVFAEDKDNKILLPVPIKPIDKDGEKWVEKTLKGMTLEQKVGQMFMVWARMQFLNVQSPEFLKLRDDLQRFHLGGFGVTDPFEDGLLFKSEPYEAAMLINALQSDSDVPLLVAADFERGLAMRLDGVTSFPHAMAFGATHNPDYARDYGRIVGEEARAIGVHWNLFPDADVNSNPANPIINTRSFGEDPQQVGAMVARLHRRRAPVRHAHHRQALPRTRRHRHRHPPGRPRASTRTSTT